MKKEKKFEPLSPLEAAHQSAAGLYDAKIIDGSTMRTFDALCLPEVKDLKPREIKSLRLSEKISQAVFAQILNTSTSTIRQWETGEKHPRGLSLKLLNLVAVKGIAILLKPTKHYEHKKDKAH